MISIGSKLVGDMSADLDKFTAQVREKVLFSGAAAMAGVIYEAARSNAESHKKSGQLQDAIYRAYSPEKSGVDSKTYRISWNKKKAPHGHLIEFGTSRAPAYPFLRPAFDRVKEAIEAGKTRMRERAGDL